MFKDKVVWITGASSGIGEAVSLLMADDGARLVLSSRRKEELERVAKVIVDLGGNADDVMVLPLDVTDEAAMPEAVDAVMEQFGRIDMLFNNAGISQRSLCVDTSMETYRKLFDVDVFGQIALTKLVLPIMIEQKSGHLVVTSSVAGKVGVAIRTGYCAVKHAMMGFFDALRCEVAEHNIKVTTVTPGFINTNISINAVQGDGSKYGKMDEVIAGGMEVGAAAVLIMKGLRAGKYEIAVGEGMSMLALKLKRWMPNRLIKMMVKMGTP